MALALLLPATTDAHPQKNPPVGHHVTGGFHPSPHPAAVVKRWQFRHRVTPFYCPDEVMTFDGGWYAIPCANVNAESGGRGGWTCNTYGVIDGPWGAFGGYAFASSACSASERAQSVVASRIWRLYGASAWAPFE